MVGAEQNVESDPDASTLYGKNDCAAGAEGLY